ncbi:MAG TPA: hypothetical protein VJH70_03030 [Candidatus Paceibacterota bacterium]
MHRLIFSIIFVASILIAVTSSAQTAPEFITSWRAINYVPATYLGKIFPTKGSIIIVGFDLLDKNQFVNLSKAEIQWDIDNTVLQTGIGIQQVQFQSNTNTNQHVVRITIRNFGTSELNYTFTIPIKKPLLIIDAPVPNRQLSLGPTLFRALPYFFNTNNLSTVRFQWSRNGQIVTGDANTPNALTLEISSEGNPVDSDITLSASAQNILNPLENATQLLNLKIR